MSIDTIPAELLEAIFSRIDAWKDLTAVRLVCRRWATAVEPMLASRSCLKVAHRVRYKYDFGVERTRLIEKNILMNSNQRYTNLSIEYADDRKERKKEGFEELLDTCQERYLVKKLRLRITPDEELAGLFVERRDWLENLTELHVELGSVLYEETTKNAEIEITLPVLKQLTWLQEDEVEKEEEDVDKDYFGERYVRCYTYVLNLPKLDRLKVRLSRMIEGIRLNSAFQTPNVCCLFQPRLKLKSCKNLKHVEIEGLTELRPEYFDACETLLQNVKSLSFFQCYSTVFVTICKMCTNLEELIVSMPLGSILPLYNSPEVCRVLKKLTLRGITDYSEPEEDITLPELRYLRLIDVSASLISGNVTLVMPKLTTLVVSRLDYGLLNIPYKDQIRTMAVELDCWYESRYDAPPPNVTELFLRQRFEEPTAVQHYLQSFPNLSRLTVYGIEGTFGTTLDCGVIRRDLPLLEYFHAHEVTLQLADIHHLKYLKSLILSQCTITTTPGDREVVLKELEYFRVKRVTLEGSGWECFPIFGNERQPPVETVEQFPNGWKTFSTLNLQLQRWTPSNSM